MPQNAAKIASQWVHPLTDGSIMDVVSALEMHALITVLMRAGNYSLIAFYMFCVMEK